MHISAIESSSIETSWTPNTWGLALDANLGLRKEQTCLRIGKDTVDTFSSIAFAAILELASVHIIRNEMRRSRL